MQAAEYGVEVIDGVVEAIAQEDGLFVAQAGGVAWRARSGLLATGVVNHAPVIASGMHDEAVARGLLRYCPICDGYEAMDRWIAVIGTQAHGHDGALFLRMYSAAVTLIAPNGGHMLCEREGQQLTEAGIALRDGPCGPLRIAGFYAAGDKAKGLDQISHAIGEAGVAATTIRNDLAKKRRLFR